MRFISRLLLAAVVLMSVSAAFGTSTLVVSTGFNGSGNLIQSDHGCDAHWTATPGTSANADFCASSFAEVVLGPSVTSAGSADPDFDAIGSPWVNDTLGPCSLPTATCSMWETVNAADTTDNAGKSSPYSYISLNFYLTDTNNNPYINGGWAASEMGAIFLNGNQITSSTFGQWTALANVLVCAQALGPCASAGSVEPTWFNTGLNTLKIIFEPDIGVDSTSGGVQDGAIFQGSITGDGPSFSPPAGPTPEPGSLLLVLAGLGGGLLWRRRSSRA